MEQETSKHSQYPLIITGEYFDKVQTIIDALFEIPRTGWVDRGVENPETVGEHTDELISLANIYGDIPDLKFMLKIHDWAEVDKKIGDRRTDPLCPPERRWTKEQKYIAEKETMTKISSKLGPYGPRIFYTWIEFEERTTRCAQIAFQLDKFQMIMKAIQYQKAGAPVIAQEFVDHNGRDIKDPILRQIFLDELAKLK